MDRLQKLIDAGDIAGAIAALDSLIAATPDDDALLFMRGKLRWKTGDRPGATSDYLRSRELNPSGPAATALKIARDIEHFFNPDLLNP